jgi:hypothetical protein
MKALAENVHVQLRCCSIYFWSYENRDSFLFIYEITIYVLVLLLGHSDLLVWWLVVVLLKTEIWLHVSRWSLLNHSGRLSPAAAAACCLNALSLYLCVAVAAYLPCVMCVSVCVVFDQPSWLSGLRGMYVQCMKARQIPECPHHTIPFHN